MVPSFVINIHNLELHRYSGNFLKQLIRKKHSCLFNILSHKKIKGGLSQFESGS